MNSDILKRMVRAIADGSQAELERLARKIVDTERKARHSRLADQLEAILDRPRKKSEQARTESERGLTELPLSRRYGNALATWMPRESLEHHMVLPPSAEERFARIEREYAARERLGAFGLRPRKTVLLYGPPGCGKSLGAKRLAWNIGLPLMKARFDALLSSYFGESLANLRELFEAAKERPCVLVLDECDFIARSRTNSKDIGEASRIVNALLQLMEDYDAPGLLVATTNIEGALDEALFRRFDEILRVPPPGPSEIEKLLKLTLSAIQLAPDICWGRLVEQVSGSSAAAIVKLAQDAAKAAVLGGLKLVAESHLTCAIAELKRSEDERQG